MVAEDKARYVPTRRELFSNPESGRFERHPFLFKLEKICAF